MALILFIGGIGVLLALLFKEPLVQRISGNNYLLKILEKANARKDPYRMGLILFALNAVLFVCTLFLLSMVSHLLPYFHFLILVLAVSVSLYLWLLQNKAWEGTKKDRLKAGIIGSSFHFFLTLLFIYWLITLKPSYPSDNTFMRGIGLMAGIIVTGIGFLTCLVITGFSKHDH